MTDAHTEMHAAYTRLNSLLAEIDRPITDDDRSSGKIAEVIRWCRDKLGGRDEDLVGPERWEQASREGWSVSATYRDLPTFRPGATWARYIHEWAHYVYLMLPARGGRNYDSHSPTHARLELELTELVVGWLADEMRGIKRTFPPLNLSRPPDLRRKGTAGP